MQRRGYYVLTPNQQKSALLFKLLCSFDSIENANLFNWIQIILEITRKVSELKTIMEENDYANKSAEDLENSETIQNLIKDGFKYKNVIDANVTDIFDRTQGFF